MPTYRGITFAVVSQYDVLAIPEYPPPPPPLDDPFALPTTLITPSQSLVSVYIPSYPASTFWLQYSIAEPYPPEARYYFKLYIDDAHIISWGCGEEDNFRGKTMFGLYAGPDGGIERRMLSFAANPNARGMMEIRVYRARGRRRIPVKAGQYELECTELGHDKPTSGMSLINAGILHTKHPKRYFQYSLHDPIDTPFARFRYYYHSWNELKLLGVREPQFEASTPSSEVLNSIETAVIKPHSSPISLESLCTPPSKLRYEEPSPTYNSISPLRIPAFTNLQPVTYLPPPSPPLARSSRLKKNPPSGTYPRPSTPIPTFGEILNRFDDSPSKSHRRFWPPESLDSRKDFGVPARSNSPENIPVRPSSRRSRDSRRSSLDSKGTGNDKRKVDFGGLIAQLVRRTPSPSPDRGRGKLEYDSSGVGSAVGVADDVYEKIGPKGSIRMFRGIVGASLTRKGKAGSSTSSIDSRSNG